MSLEEEIRDLKIAITKLHNVMNSQFSTIQNATTQSQIDKGIDRKTAEKETPAVQEKAEQTAEPNSNDEPEMATRQQYVFFKDTKTAVILKKGDVIPTDGDPVRIKKPKFDELCEKYDLDPATGKKAVASETDDDGFDADTDDDDMGPEESTGPDRETVRSKLIEYMKLMGGNRELGLKVLQKFGATSSNDLAPKDFQACYDLTQKQIDKQKPAEKKTEALDDI